MPAPLDPSADLGYQANRLARLLRAAVAREVAPLGLTTRQAAVVLQLAGAEPLSMGALAETIGVDRPTLTGIVERLTREGWIATSVNDADRRSRLVTLTEASRSRVEQVAAAAGRASSGALAGLPTADASELVALLGRVADGLEAALSTTTTSERSAR